MTADRIIRSATLENFADEEGVPDPALAVPLYAALSAPTVITGFMAVSPDGRAMQPRQAGMWNDAQRDAWARIVAEVRRARPQVRLIAQLAHAGLQTTRPGALSPSGGRSPYFRNRSRAMTADDIRRVADDFAPAAARARQAGFDGVQIHAAHGYLVHQFLSPATNRRRDEWGDPGRFLADILRAVREMPYVLKVNNAIGFRGLPKNDDRLHDYNLFVTGGRIDGKYCNSTGRQEMLAEGIKAEVDLREASDVPSKSPLGSDVAFFAPGFDSGYNHMVRDNQPKVKETFMWVVQRLREDKPVYFHCAAGRDRTATLAVLLEGVLGISESDMAKDYELTYFSPTDWGMSENGTVYKHTRDNYSYGSIRKTIYNEISSGTYQERITKYLLKIGVPQKDIDDLRSIMLR